MMIPPKNGQEMFGKATNHPSRHPYFQAPWDEKSLEDDQCLCLHRAGVPPPEFDRVMGDVFHAII